MKPKIKQIIVGELLTNCYLFFCGGETAVIDPGGDGEKILEEIKNKKAKVKYIINTHYHFDHTAANGKISEKTKAEILIHEGERDFINFKPSRFLKEGDEIKIGDCFLKVIHTPGHSKGSICLLGKNFVFSGDTFFKDGYGRVDLPGGSVEELEKSLKKLAKLLKSGFMVYPGHNEIFKI